MENHRKYLIPILLWLQNKGQFLFSRTPISVGFTKLYYLTQYLQIGTVLMSLSHVYYVFTFYNLPNRMQILLEHSSTNLSNDKILRRCLL